MLIINKSKDSHLCEMTQDYADNYNQRIFTWIR